MSSTPPAMEEPTAAAVEQQDAAAVEESPLVEQVAAEVEKAKDALVVSEVVAGDQSTIGEPIATNEKAPGTDAPAQPTVHFEDKPLIDIPSRPQTSVPADKADPNAKRPRTGPATVDTSSPSSRKDPKEEVVHRPQTTAGASEDSLTKEMERSQELSNSTRTRPQTTPNATQYGVSDVTGEKKDDGETVPPPEEEEAVLELPIIPEVSDKKLNKKVYKQEVYGGDGVWHKGRKVALMEHIHFKHTGKSLQEQISAIYKKVRQHDDIVTNLQERSATRGDLDALARTKADKSVLDKETALFAERTKNQLKEKCDLQFAESRLKTKVEWTGLKAAVSGFVKPLMFDIIAQKLPEAVEETKAGLVVMIQRMFEVDPEQKADMEAVKHLRDEVAELKKQIVISERKHETTVKGFTDIVSAVRAEVQESAEERLQEQIQFLNEACDSKLADMTKNMEVLMQTSKEQVKNSVQSLRDKNERIMLRMREEGTEIVQGFVEDCKKEKKKFVQDVQDKYANDMKDITLKVKQCERICADANVVVSALKAKLKEVEGFVRGTTKRMTACEKQAASVAVTVQEFSKDFEDVRETEIQLRRDLTAVEGVFDKLTRRVDSNSTQLSNVAETEEEHFQGLKKQIATVVEKQKDANTKISNRVRVLEDQSKAGGRKIDLKIQDVERSFYDRLNIQAQQARQDTKDVQGNTDKLKQEMLRKFQKKTKEISSVDNKIKKMGKQLHQSKGVLTDVKKDVERLSKIEKKVDTLMSGMEKGNSSAGMALAALKKAEKLQEELFEQHRINEEQQEELDAMPVVEPEPEIDPILIQLEELQQNEREIKVTFDEASAVLKEKKNERKMKIMEMRLAQQAGDKAKSKSLQRELDIVDEEMEGLETSHDQISQALAAASENVQAVAQIANMGATQGGPPSHRTTPQSVSMVRTPGSAQSVEVVVRMPSVSKSRGSALSRGSIRSRSRGPRTPGPTSLEVEALQAEIEGERNLRFELQTETEDIRRTQNALLHTQESFREKMLELQHMIVDETESAIRSCTQKFEGIVENVKLKHVEEMEEQRQKLEQVNEKLREEQAMLLKRLQDSNKTLENDLGGAEFQMSSVKKHEGDGPPSATVTETQMVIGNIDNHHHHATQLAYETQAQLMFEKMREQHEEEMITMRKELQAARDESHVGKITELNDVIQELHGMHKDSTDRHAAEIEKMHAKMAAHSLKVDSFQAIAEADNADATYAQKLVDEQTRIMKELDLESLASQLHEEVHKKLLAHVEFKCDVQLQNMKKMSDSAQEDHQSVLKQELQGHIDSLMKASGEVQETHEKHLSHHHNRIMEMAEKMQNQHEIHVQEVQHVVSAVHKSLTDINENSRYHMQKFQIQSQQMGMKIADLEEWHKRETAKDEYKHMREMRTLQNLNIEDRSNVREELALVKMDAEKEHEKFLAFTHKLTHEHEKMRRNYEKELSEVQDRLKNSIQKQQLAERKMATYAKEETLRRMNNIQFPEVGSPDPVVNRALTLQQVQAAQKLASVDEQGPDGPNDMSFNDARSIYTSQSFNTAPNSPAASNVGMNKSYGGVGPSPTPGNPVQSRGNMSSSGGYFTPYPGPLQSQHVVLQGGRELDLFVQQTELSLRNSNQLIVAVHERLSNELTNMKTVVNQYVGEGEFDSRMKKFWSEVGDLKHWKNKVVDLSSENELLLKELQRKSPDRLILGSPKRKSAEKKKQKKQKYADTHMFMSLPEVLN